MPVLLRQAGFVFRFSSGDGAEPAHVHVFGNRGKAKIWLDTGEFARSRGYDLSQETAIWQITMEHRDEWIERWDRFFGQR